MIKALLGFLAIACTQVAVVLVLALVKAPRRGAYLVLARAWAHLEAQRLDIWRRGHQGLELLELSLRGVGEAGLRRGQLFFFLARGGNRGLCRPVVSLGTHVGVGSGGTRCRR